ncbi:MAG: hypothetical protein OXG29_11545 [Gammaproteobacteria bacterium]|nr:hypothetical protein [Gammaproteobacteria bacterium]
MRAEAPRLDCRHGIREKYPDMASIAGAGSFNRSRHALRVAGRQESLSVAPPCLLVEVDSQKTACVVRADGVNPDRVPAPQMPLYDFVGEGEECLIGAGAAFDGRFAAHAWLPLVGASRRVTRLPCAGVLPALRKNILTSAEKGTEQGDLCVRLRLACYVPCGLMLVLRDAPGSQQIGQPGFKHRPFIFDLRQSLAHKRNFVVRWL